MSGIWLLAIYVIFGLVLIGLLIFLFSRYFKRATNEIAFVRSGSGKTVVAISRGAFVLPVLHTIMWVNMKTIEINIERNASHSLRTSDNLRVDISASFFVRVNKTDDDIILAAQTLGKATMDVDAMRNMFQERCEAALRVVASNLKMDELNGDQASFKKKVQEYLTDDLRSNGLFLQSVALTHINQTELSHFDANNALDSQGLAILAERIAADQVKQAESEANKEIRIREQQFKAEKERIDREQRLIKEEEEKRKKINEIKQKTEKEIEFARVEKERDIELFRQTKERLIAEGQRKVAQVWISTDKIKAEAAKAAEEVITAKENAQAERNKIVELVGAEREAQRQRILARADSDAKSLEAQSAALQYKVEADGKRAYNDAMNSLSPEQTTMQIKMAIVNQMPDIIKESSKPLKNIDSIKIMHVDGINGGAGGGTGDGKRGPNDSTSLPDQVVNSALKHRAQAPMIDSLLREIGLKGADATQMTRALTEEVSDHDLEAEANNEQASANQDDKKAS